MIAEINRRSVAGLNLISSLHLLFAVVVGALLVSGCAGHRAYNEGRQLIESGETEKGLAKLAEAVQQNSGNVEYRIALRTKRVEAVTSMLRSAEEARRSGRLVEAETLYTRVQGMEPGNPMARQGLDALVMERRHRKALAILETELSKGNAADLDVAADQLRTVLAENPNQREALNFKARLEDLKLKQAAPEAELAAVYLKPITLEFRDAPLKSVFDAIAKVSNLNFFFDKDIRPDLRATLLAKNTSIEDAIRLVLITNQLEQKVLNRNSILIYPNTPQKIKDYQTVAVRTFYLANADVKAISNTIKTILKTQDLVIDERLGLLIMRDTPEVIRLAEKIISLQDLAEPEVMLDVEVLEVKRTRLLELGVSWPDQVTLSPLAANGETLTLRDLLNPSQSTTQAAISSGSVTARDQKDDADILANPRIRVRNKDTARILIGDRVPVITTTSTSTGFVSDSVTYVDVGLKLEAEPNIYLDRDVAIKIHLEVSNLVKEITSKAGTLAYQIGTRSADTVLRLKDGETQILAGLISDEDRASANRLPALGSLPLLSRLFGSRKDDHSRSEIVLAITPHVVRSLQRPDMVSAEFESGTQTTVGARSLSLRTVEQDVEKATDVGKPSNTHAAGASAIAAAPAQSGKEVNAAAAAAATSATAAAAATQRSPNGETHSPSVAGAGVGAPSLSWQVPNQVKAGEQFTAILSISSENAVRGLPSLIGFDPQVLQVASVNEGNYLRQNAALTDFSHRVDPIQGKIFVAAVRQNASGYDTGVTGSGTVVEVTFKALKAMESTAISLLSISPEPQPTSPISVPLLAGLKVLP